MDPTSFPYLNVFISGLIWGAVALALAKLMASPLPDTSRLLWVIVIIGVPILGPVAFLLFNERWHLRP